MRKYGVLAAAAGLALAGSVAKADFTITAVRVDLSNASNANLLNGAYAGHEMIEFFAHNNGGGTGTKLLTTDVTMSDQTGSDLLVMGGYASASPASGAAPDLKGANGNTNSGGAVGSNGTVYQFGGRHPGTSAPYYSFATMLGDPTDGTSNDPTVSFNNPLTSPAATFANYGSGIASWRIQLGSTTGGVAATTDNGGLGALFAVAVVPTGDSVAVSGTLGGDLGNPSTFSAASSVPEPASVALLGIGMAGLLARRRRSA